MDEYTVHNYSAVDQQIEQIAKREKARTFAFWMQSGLYLCGYVALAVVLVVILSIGLSWAYRIATDVAPEKIVEVVRPEIIERETVRIVEVPVTTVELQPTIGGNFRTLENERQTRSSPDTDSLDKKVVTNYTTFKTVTVDVYKTWDITSVVTGWNYDDSEQPLPSIQYCYASKQVTPLSSLRIDLAKISGSDFESFINNETAQEAAVPKKILLELQSECLWASE